VLCEPPGPPPLARATDGEPPPPAGRRTPNLPGMHACELASSAIEDKDKTMGDWERTRKTMPQLANQTLVLPSSNSQISILPIGIDHTSPKLLIF
jgi:hypothetical protein